MDTPQIDELIIFLGQISGAVIAITAALAILHRVFFKKLTDRLDTINKELHPNGGSSLRDVVNRIENNQKELKKDVEGVREKVDDHIVWHLDN
jgi:hypothetical protein